MKICSKYKWGGGNIYGGKLTITKCDKPKQLLNQRGEIFNICRDRKKLLNLGIKGLIKIVQRRKRKEKQIVFE